MPLSPMFAFKDSPSSLRLLEIPKKIGEWNITTVKVAVNYPDNTSTTYTASRNGNVWVVTFNGCSITGKVANGLEILADGTDENGDAVNGYVLGVGDIYILDRDADIEEAVSKHIMKYCDETPETPVAGDVVVETGTLKFYDGTQWISIDTDLQEYATKEELNQTKGELEDAIDAVQASIPTNVSQLNNDIGYITSTQVEPAPNWQGYALNALYAAIMRQPNFENTGINPIGEFEIKYEDYDFNLLLTGYYLSNWSLTKYGDFTYDTPVELEWGYFKLQRIRAGRPATVYTGWGWKSKTPDANGYTYAISVTNGTVLQTNVTPAHFFVDTGDGQKFAIKNAITLSQDGFSIDALDGQTGVVICTRLSDIPLPKREYLAKQSDLPTKTSDLLNDSGFITSSAIPSNVSSFVNDAGYLTTVSWSDVQDKPSIPTKTSDLTNDSGYITSTQVKPA